MGNKKGFLRKIWGRFGCFVIVIAMIVVGLMIDSILILLSKIPVIGFVAKWILYLRGTAY